MRDPYIEDAIPLRNSWRILLVGYAHLEVRVTVKLTNTGNLTLVRRQHLRSEEVRSVEANALIDTGAVSFTLPSLVVERLGLARPFKQVVEYADGRREEVDVTEPVLVELMGRHTVEEALVLGDEVLIGHTHTGEDGSPGRLP